MRAYKFRIYPSKAQEMELGRYLEIEKNLWNMLLENTKKKYEDEKLFYSKIELQKMVRGSKIYAQSAQAIAHRLYRALQAKIRADNKGQKCGFPRFKPLERMKSIHYPQDGFSLNRKLKVSSFGEISIVKHRIIKGRIRTLTLKRETSGRWHAIFIVDEDLRLPKKNNGERVGLDLGLNRLATLSDGRQIKKSLLSEAVFTKTSPKTTSVIA